MGVIEIIGGVLIVVLSIIIIAAVTVQESKGGLGSALAGDVGGSFFDKNRGNTKEAMLVRATTICGIALVVVILVVLFAAL
ncbi:MAG: preprotein translocase subunit SecG [Oscillospiraceae bacterium]|nr:preprotein translocase subunit SecG [Oscillospiraceae bacterium]